MTMVVKWWITTYQLPTTGPLPTNLGRSPIGNCGGRCLQVRNGGSQLGETLTLMVHDGEYWFWFLLVDG